MKRAAQGDISPPPTKRKIESTTTSKAVSSFFKPSSQKEPEQISWRIVDDSLIIGRYEPQTIPPQARKTPVKIAAFDLDDTLISATGGNKWARNATSWKWWDTSVPGKLKSLYEEGYLVAIFTNQGNVSLKGDPKKLQKDTASLTNLKQQLISVLRQLDLPISVYGAAAQDKYRKPRIGMWEELLEDYDIQSAEAVDYAQSFYVGDAAGREKTEKRKKDWAASDRHLAANIGIDFHTPEEFFLGVEAEPYDHGFEPRKYLQSIESKPAQNGVASTFTKNHSQELVIFCGSPGAGKSTWYWTHLEPLGFVRVNQDTLKTRDKCIKVAREHLSDGVSVAVDNTNADVETRRYWINIARDFKIPIRLVHFTASARLCEHNDSVRALNSEVMNPEKRSMLPGIAFSSFKGRYREPTLAEGFEDITKVDFDFKGTPEQREIWSRFWVSKFST